MSPNSHALDALIQAVKGGIGEPTVQYDPMYQHTGGAGGREGEDGMEGYLFIGRIAIMEFIRLELVRY